MARWSTRYSAWKLRDAEEEEEEKKSFELSTFRQSILARRFIPNSGRKTQLLVKKADTARVKG